MKRKKYIYINIYYVDVYWMFLFGVVVMYIILFLMSIICRYVKLKFKIFRKNVKIKFENL